MPPIVEVALATGILGLLLGRFFRVHILILALPVLSGASAAFLLLARGSGAVGVVEGVLVTVLAVQIGYAMGSALG